MSVYKKILKNKSANRKMLAVLIDPDNNTSGSFAKIAKSCQEAKVDIILAGGSLITTNNFDKCIEEIRSNCDIPVMLFPGGVMQISIKADGILLLSLISGRNPDMLIGKHVETASIIRKSGLESIPTGYILVDGGKITSVQYISNTIPIPADKNDIAVSTAIAGEMLGMKLIYLEAGSGAINPVPLKMITAVSNEIALPLCVGGGIRTPESAIAICKAGANIIVIGNAFEKNYQLIGEISCAIHELSTEHHNS